MLRQWNASACKLCACAQVCPASPAHALLRDSRTHTCDNTGTVSAADLLVAAAATPRIISMARDLDALLGGGVAAGQVTEFCECAGHWHWCARPARA